MADSDRSVLRARGRSRGRHARLIVRYFAREVPFVMGSPKTACAARRAQQCSHATSASFLVSQALIRGGWLEFDRALSRVLSGTPGSCEWWVYEGSVRPRNAPSPRALLSRPPHSRSRSERAGAVPMPWLPREMPNPCVSTRDLAQERKRVSLGGVAVSTRRHRTRNRARRSSRASGILGHNHPHHAWIKWLQNIGCSGSSYTRLLTRETLASHLTHERPRGNDNGTNDPSAAAAGAQSATPHVLT